MAEPEDRNAFTLTAPSAPAGQLPADSARVERFKQLTEEILPALAQAGHWPVHFDHCFKRICLDHAFGDVWYKHLPRPAERHLRGEPLERAIRCAEELRTVGLPALERLDAASLQYRGKRPKRNKRTS